MLTLLASIAAHADVPERYACHTTNPIPGAVLAVRFAVDPRGEAPFPLTARVYDLESRTLLARTGDPVRRPEYDLADPDRDAWHLGEDEVAEYLLLLPHRPLDELEEGVTLTEVYGGGQAQWVSELLCERR